MATRTYLYYKILAMLLAMLLTLSVVNVSDADAAKRKRLHLVTCPNVAGSIGECVGTSSRDKMVGRDFQFDRIDGREGNDLYDGKGGNDVCENSSTTSSDTYRISVKEFSGTSGVGIRDRGGNKDTIDLRTVYKAFEFDFSTADRDFDGQADELVMDGPGTNNIVVLDFLTENTIDFYKFKDKTFTADQVRALAK